MTATTMMNRRNLGRLVAAVACAGLTIAATVGAARPQGAKPQATAADPWYSRAPTIAFDSLKSPDGRFQFDMPKKDWLAITGAGTVQVVAASTKGVGTFLIERSVLNQPLEPADITDLFAELETDALKKERQPGATDVMSRIIDANGHRVVGIQFNRPGFGGRQRARQYSIPMGTVLYRLTCAAAESRFEAFAPLCAHVAFTLTPLAP